jgi:rare lipoprotein A
MRPGGRALTLACVLLLAACGGHRGTRPPTVGGGSHAVHAGEGGRGGFHDDVSKPQSSRYRDSSDSVPGGPPPDLSKLVEPVPKLEPRALYGNKSPYTVLGRTYRVLPTAKGYVERGIASFYGSKFDGYKTSSLETYDMYGFSAAHKTLPLPSYARVTNLENGKSVVVRINDRGPFHENRLIDLSYAAAVKIGVWPKGTGLVEVRALDPAHPDAASPPMASVPGPSRPAPVGAAAAALPQELPATPAVPVAGARPVIYLQVGAFADVANAERVAQRLRAANFAPVQVIDVQVNGRDVRRVRLGPLPDVDRADAITSRIENMGLPRPEVAVD